MTPKSLLRARQARSQIVELVEGRWREVLDDTARRPATGVSRLVLCSGKVAYDAMAAPRQDRRGGGAPVAIARVEQLYPVAGEQIAELLAAYPGATEVVWLQEEPENMGAWMFVHGRLHRLLAHELPAPPRQPRPSGSPATGSGAIHQLEQEDILDRSVGSVPA